VSGQNEAASPELVALRNAAREAARSKLVQKHAVEYRVLLNIERRKRGLGEVKP
jgi:hypothetical protein